jgi:hypothetical protein
MANNHQMTHQPIHRDIERIRPDLDETCSFSRRLTGRKGVEKHLNRRWGEKRRKVELACYSRLLICIPANRPLNGRFTDSHLAALGKGGPSKQAALDSSSRRSIRQGSAIKRRLRIVAGRPLPIKK